jgi:hypothetical protein
MTPHPATLDPALLLRDCEVRRTRGSGPGGQHRNKVETALELVHKPTGVRAAAGESRSQNDNQKAAMFRLRVNLALHVRLPYELGAPPSDLWQSRCRKGRIALNQAHDDFPAMLAEALDVIATLRFDVGKAAAALSCTPSQLVKLLKDEPRALTLVNEQREKLGLRRLL